MLALVVGSGCGGGATQTTASTCCEATAVVTEADQVEAAAKAAFGDDYAGLSVEGTRLIVYTAGTIPPELPAPLDPEAVKVVRYNLVELEGFKTRLDAVADEAISQGVRLVSWEVEPATNSVGVGVASDITAAEAVLAELVGPDVPIRVVAEAPVTT